MTTDPPPPSRNAGPSVSSGTGPGERSGDRVILHVDMDSFFASVEVLDDPTLAGKPVIVGGSGNRGVVAACTYEARKFGIHSAMASSVARRLCPQAVFVDGRFHRYVEESRRLHAILDSYTPLVEGISLDEAFLDVSGTVHLFGSGPTMGHAIRDRVRSELRLDCSVGVGRSKLMAKLASKAAKPQASRNGIEPGPGVVAVPADGELAFLHPMPARALWGIGPATEKRLLALGVTTVGELAAVPTESLERYLGSAAGRHLSELSRAVDDRPVVPDQEAKSIGHEETFSSDLWELAELQSRLQRMVDASATALRKAERAARTITVKLRFGDFTQITRSHTLDGPVDATPAIAAVATALLDSVDLSKGVRLLGISLTGLVDPGVGTQLRLDLEPAAESIESRDTRGTPSNCSSDGDPAGALRTAGLQAGRLQETWGSVTGAVDSIRARYGGAAVGPASSVDADGIHVRRRGEAQWGPGGSDVTGGPDRDRDALENRRKQADNL